MIIEKFTLGELCTIEKGTTGILKAIPGKYPLVVTGENRKSHNEFQFDGEVVIIPLVSGTGHGHASIKRIHYQSGKFALGSILCAVIPKDKSKLIAEYLYYFLNLNRENELVARMRGMANVTLPMKEIAKIEIPLPSLDDQIVFVKMYKVLREQSNGLSLELTHQLNLVKKLRQQLLQDAIQGKVVEQDFNDKPASVLLRKIKAEKEQLIKDKKLKKEKDLPQIKYGEIAFDIPKNWVWCRLGEIVSILGDGLHGTPSYSSTGEYYFINGNNLINGKIEIKENTKKVSKVEFEKYKKPMNSNTILISINGTLGNIAFYNNEKIILGKSACYFNLLNNLDKNFISELLKSQYFLKYAVEVASETTIKNVSLKSMRYFPVPLPPLAEQYRIVKKIECLMHTCDSLESSIKQSQLQNEQLLQQVLREALTKEVEQEERLIADYVELKENEKYKALLLAAEIIWQLNQKQTLGHIKLQKLIYLCNRTRKMNLPVNFLKWAMGPYDPELQKYIDQALVDNQWFNYDENASIKYQPLIKAGNHKADFNKYFVDDKEAINHLIQLFENAKSARIEIVATLFACWEELIKGNQIVSDNALLVAFYNWSEKKKKHTTEKVIDALRWMESEGIVPKTIDYL